MGLFFPSNNSLEINAYSDADWGARLETRRCLIGYCIFMGSALVSWKTKKQSTVSRSTTKGEYRAMAATLCEFQWISFILRDFKLPISIPIPFYCDNQATIHIA